MRYDFFTTYDWSDLEGLTQKKAIDYLLGKNAKPPDAMSQLAEVIDPAARLHLLALAVRSTNKDYARTGDYREKGGLLWAYENAYATFLAKQHHDYLAPLGLVPDSTQLDLTLLPPHSTFIQFTFTLAAPYISRDDEAFHINDNPVRKDNVFKVPMVAPSGWKGALRATLWQLGYKEHDERIKRLFGNDKDDETLLAGSLHFYPTFFDRIGLEVINPHDRATGTGKLPIYFECVPAGTEGTFSLLYVPSVFASQEDVAQDLQLAAQGIEAMLTVYGFGAKTSSGYGCVEDALVAKGTIALHAHLPSLSEKTPVPPTTQPEPLKAPSRYQEPSGELIADLRRDDGSLKSETEYQAMIEQQGRQHGKKDKQFYEKAAKWWEREGREMWQQSQQTMPEPEPEPDAEPEPKLPKLTICSFGTLHGLCEKVDMIATALEEAQP